MPSLNFKVTSDDFLNASKQFDVVPVHAVIDSISLRPIDALKALRSQGEPAFIFESESPEDGAPRYAYVCPKVEQVVLTGENESLGDTNPITALREHFESRRVASLSDLPELVTGAFGYIAYEAIKHFEPSVGELPADPTGSPTSVMLLPAELLVFERALDQLHIIVFTSRSQTFESAETRISNGDQIRLDTN